jgi:predicted MFS family arabinose efflux permease
MGVAGLIGTYIIGLVITKGLSRVLLGTPLAMAALAIALIGADHSLIAEGVMLTAWGSWRQRQRSQWRTWLSRVLPDDAEAAGGLMVAVIQMAIALGAAGGGLLYDASGYRSTFTISAVALCGSALEGGGWRGAKSANCQCEGREAASPLKYITLPHV